MKNKTNKTELFLDWMQLVVFIMVFVGIAIYSFSNTITTKCNNSDIVKKQYREIDIVKEYRTIEPKTKRFKTINDNG